MALTSFFRAQDLIWLCLIAVLVFFGPQPQTATTLLLTGLAVFQLVESKVAFFSDRKGAAIAFAIKLLLCYLLIGWTDGIASSYFWILLLPVLSAATSFDLLGTSVASFLACGVYLSFLLYLGEGLFVAPDQVPELILRLTVLLVVGYLTHTLAADTRGQANKYQAAAEQLADVNRTLQEAEDAVRRSDRLAALGQMSAGLAHELRNPLGTMKASAEMLERNVQEENDLAREMAGFIVSEVDRTNSLITRFLDFARPLSLQLIKTDLHDVLDKAVRELERHQPPLNVGVYKNYSPEIPPIPLDAEMMQRVIYNLLLNAAEVSPAQGTITLKTRLLEDEVEVAVIDRGSGIDPKHRENIFNPFFTTKPAGVGLGLAIVAKIVDEHGGNITVESEPGQGTAFRMYLRIEA